MTVYQLVSVSLLPTYYHWDMVTPDEMKPVVSKIIVDYWNTGLLFTRQTNAETADKARTVGYDYGILLYALTVLGHSDAERFCREILALLDRSGSWSEYYSNGEPLGTRYRPWESGINLESILYWLGGRKEEQIER